MVGISSLLRYAWDGANGNRTVGYYAHITATVHYLAHARYLYKILIPPEILNTMIKKDSITPVLEENSCEG